MASLGERLLAASQSVLLLSRPSDAVLRITGRDRQSWLNGLVTCDLGKAKAGEAVYGLALGQKGRIMTDLAALFTDEAILVILPQRHREEVMVAFDRYLIMEDVEVTPMEGVAVYEGHGPNAMDLCDVGRGAGAWAAPFDRTGRGGVLVVADSARGPAVDGALAKAVAECQGLVGPEEDWEALRLDVGLPAMDHDFGPSTYPQEAGLEKTAVSFSKGCYLGQEVVCMLEMRGQVKRRLVALELPGDHGLPSAGTSVDAADGQSIGEVSSAAHLPHRGTHRLLAMVKRQWADGPEDLLIQGHRASRIS